MVHIFTGPSGSEKSDGFLNRYSIRAGQIPTYNITKVMLSPAWQSIQKFSKIKNIVNHIQTLRNDSAVTCQNLPTLPNCQNTPCLFDLENDPCEEYDLSKLYPVFVSFMKDQLDRYRANLVKQKPWVLDPAANTEKFNYTWSIWVD